MRRSAIIALSGALMLAPTAPRAQTSGQAALWGTQGADCVAKAGQDRAWTDPSYSPECRARFVLREFRTIDEKLRFLDPPPADAQGGSTVRDVAKAIGLPSFAASDGPAGVVNGPAATAFPSPLAVAASFDPAVATRYGDLLGREFHAAGYGTLLGPAYDMTRSWRFGRLSESFGEDPFLVASLSGPQVAAIQARHVVVTMKHFAAYTQEAGRVGDQPSGTAPSGNNMLSEKALREIYLPGFEAAVKQGGAGAVMCAFPRVNGVYACENGHLFDILKREWRFDGTVSPDFPSGQRSISRAILAGLDNGSYRTAPFNAGLAHEMTLREAVANGVVPEARIDDIILRRLIPAFRVGLFENVPKRLGEDVSTPEARAAAAEMLADGSVLLRNERAVLPFGGNVRTIAVIGVQARGEGPVVEQGSPHVNPAHLVAPLDAIKARAGRAARITYAPGTRGLGPLPVPAAGLFRTARGEAGFRADYVGNAAMDFSGRPVASTTVSVPALDKVPDVAGLPAGNGWSVRYAATLTPTSSGVHHFTLHGSGSARLRIGGVEQGRFELADFGHAIFANVPLEAGTPVAVEIDYTPRAALGEQRRHMFGLDMGLTLQFGYAPPDTLITDAARAAKAADVALVFVGEQVGEGMDRMSLGLQNDQDALIEAVAAANPRTVVVLSTGGPVAMPWLGRVAGVLETWLPGDAYGPAVAAMLFGDREPGGRLPVTFPADESQGPATQPHQFPGTRDPATGRLDTAYFDEGVHIGYRWWDAKGQTPLFPFGHGLGYETVVLTGESIRPNADGGLAVQARLANSGRRATAGVAQLYLGFPAAAHEPPRQLKGFAKVRLAPGEHRVVGIDVPREALRIWDEDLARWRVVPGRYRVELGLSSRDILWSGEIDVAGD